MWHKCRDALREHLTFIFSSLIVIKNLKTKKVFISPLSLKYCALFECFCSHLPVKVNTSFLSYSSFFSNIESWRGTYDTSSHLRPCTKASWTSSLRIHLLSACLSPDRLLFAGKPHAYPNKETDKKYAFDGKWKRWGNVVSDLITSTLKWGRQAGGRLTNGLLPICFTIVRRLSVDHKLNSTVTYP